MCRLADVLGQAIAALQTAGIDNPALDARILVGHALGLDRAELFSAADRPLSDDERKRIQSLIERRLKREPVARILGEREFWSLSFGLNEATLEPRPDSETLVEMGLAVFARSNATHPRLLDLGTGTGCLLLALLHECPHATGLGIDLSPRAIEQATLNAKNLNLADRATFRTGDWLNDIHEKFDLILSNPPYIPHADIAALMPEVRDYDPRRALDGGEDGLTVYNLLIPQMAVYLKPNGHVLFEVGQGQAAIVQNLLEKEGFLNVTIRKDFGGIARCVGAERPFSL